MNSDTLHTCTGCAKHTTEITHCLCGVQEWVCDECVLANVWVQCNRCSNGYLNQVLRQMVAEAPSEA